MPLVAAAGLQARPTPWAWQPHPEVWLLVAGLVLLWFYATRVVGPKAVPAGQPIVTRSQTRWYFGAVGVLWVAADWPLHDLAENYLYTAHMVQHLLLTFVMAPMFLLATPTWLARLVIGDGRLYGALKRLARPLLAGVLYNVVFAFAHWPTIVNDSVSSGSFHFAAHLVLVTSALLMWMCVCGPFEEMRIALPAQCIYLFLMSVLPTIPGGWLVFADGVVYKSYVHPWHSLWGLTPTDDQQFAGFFMKVIGGLYLWTIIFVLFFRWNNREEAKADVGRRERDLERVAAARARKAATSGSAADAAGQEAASPHPETVLTYDAVRDAFDRSEAPTEHVDR
jgi:putative membrane protein